MADDQAPPREAEVDPEPEAGSDAEPAAEPSPKAEPDSQPTADEASDPEALQSGLVERRHRRRQALQRVRKRKGRLTDAQQMIFILLALGFLAAWLFGRDACTRKITQTYGTLTTTGKTDGGAPAPRRRVSPPPLRPMEDGW